MVAPAYDFYLLDLDGTLVDVDLDYARAVFDRVGSRLGYDFSDRQVEQLWYGLRAPRNDLLRAWGVDVEGFWAAFHDEEDARARAEATYLYDDAARFLSRTDVPLGIVTHCQDYLTRPILTDLDLQERFDAVVCCSGTVGWKPDPAPVELAMDRLGAGDNGHRGALVGDSPHDVGAAWNAGLDGVHVERHDPADRGHCVLGDRRISKLEALTG